MNKLKLLFLSFFLLFSANSLVIAEPLQWKKFKFVTYRVKILSKGKILNKYISPDKKITLIYQRDNNSVNKNSLYIILDKNYYFIDNYQQLKNIKWSNNSKNIYFEAIKQIDNQISYWKINYSITSNIAFARVLKILQD